MEELGIELEINEIFATLKNSSIPTVLVEGKDDMIFYRRIEEELSDLGIDILPVGNKEKVLKLRDKIIKENLSLPIAVVVDKDLWVNYGIPLKYQDEVITTYGYSIENDMFIDGELLNLLTKTERVQFESDLKAFVEWYALAVDRNVNDRRKENIEYSYRNHPNQVLTKEFLDLELCLLEGENYPNNLYQSILQEYETKLRGKSLFQLLTRYLSNSKNRTSNKFGIYQLLEIGAARKGNNYQRLVTQLRLKFN